jgi:YVTN family beta-propeller protein
MFLRRRTVRPFLAALLFPVCFAAAISWLCPPAAAQSPASDAIGGRINPQGIAFNPASRKVYAVDTAHATVHVIDAARQTVTPVAVGRAPISVAVDSTSGRAYVANDADGSVSVIDGTSDKVLATVAVGSMPYSIAANSRTGAVYVSHTYTGRTTLIDPATNGVTQLATGNADLIAVDAAANTVYLLGYEGGVLTVVEGAGPTIRKQQAGPHAWGMAMNEATHTLYVARMGTGDVIALQGTSSSILPAGHTPCAVALNPDANAIYVANYGGGSVSVLDAAAGRKIADIPVGVNPQAVAVDARLNLVYVANRSSGTVTVIDAVRRKAIATLPAGKAPYALAVDPGSSKVYVANGAGERSFTIVDVKVAAGRK